jgi:hypothetical protein
MRSILLPCLGACLLLLGVQVAVSQGIIIDSNDVKLIYEIGNRIVYHHDTLTTVVDLGSTGGPNTWDFSGLKTNYLETLRSVSVGSTPYAGNFAGSTHALLDTAFAMRLFTGATFGYATLRSTEAYYYYEIGATQGFRGVQGAGNAYLDIAPTTPIPFAAKWFEVPALVDYQFPMSFLATWNNMYVDSLEATATLFGSPQSIKMGDHYIATHTVDAYGTVILPGGGTHAALRLRKLSIKNGMLITVGYVFVSRNGAGVQLSGRHSEISGGVDSVTSIRWTEGVGEDPVPVELASFTGVQVAGNGVRLSWTTLSETNNFGFTVQRRSTETQDFADLPGSFVSGHGTTLVAHSYSYLDVDGVSGEWWYRLKQTDLQGEINYSEQIRVGVLSSVSSSLPVSFALRQNFPNPFNPTTTIGYSVGAVSGEQTAVRRVRLAVYDLLGREVAVLVDEMKEPGYYAISWDAGHMPSGVYVLRMTAGEFVAQQKMVLLK